MNGKYKSKLEQLFGQLVHYVETPGDFTSQQAHQLKNECIDYAAILEAKERPEGQVFSFRAECFNDVANFMRDSALKGIDVDATVKFDNHFPDCEVEIIAMTAFEEARNIMRGIEDSHVMLQTLRPVPLEDNSLKRDHNIE